MAEEKRKRGRPPKNRSLPGFEGNKIPEISEAAEGYEEKRNARMDLLKEEVEAKGLVMSLMRKHKIKEYRDDDFEPAMIVTLEESEATLKVKREKPTKGADDDE